MTALTLLLMVIDLSLQCITSNRNAVTKAGFQDLACILLSLQAHAF